MAQRNSNKEIYCNSNKALFKVLSPFILLLIINILLVSCGLDPASGSRDVTPLALEKEKSEVLAKIWYNDCTALANASAALREDKEFMLAAVKECGYALEYAGEELRADREVVLAAVKKSGFALQYAGAAFRSDREVVLAAVEKTGYALQYADAALRSDKEFVLAAVKERGFALQYADAALRSDKEVVVTAINPEYGKNIIRSDAGLAFQYASETLRSDKQFVLDVVKKAGYKAFQYASEALRSDKEVVVTAINPANWEHICCSNNELALEFSSAALREDKEFVLDVVKKAGYKAFQYASAGLRGDREFVLAAVKENGEALKYTDAAFRSDREVVLAAVQNNGATFKYASETLRSDKQFVLDAIETTKFSVLPFLKKFETFRENVKNMEVWQEERVEEDLALIELDRCVIQYACEAFLSDREIVLAAVKNSGFALEYVSKVLFSDREIVLAAVKENGRLLKYTDAAFLSDREIVLAAVNTGPKFQSFVNFSRDILDTINEVDLWKSKENKIALLQSVNTCNKDQMWEGCICKLEGDPVSEIEKNTIIASEGLLLVPVIDITEYSCQNQDQYQVTFSTLAGKQYTIAIAGDETLDHLARTIKATLDQDKESNIQQAPYLLITYGNKRIISPSQAACSVNTIFN